jgi:hypothetical protein
LVALIVAILVAATALPVVVAKSGASHGRSATPVFRGTIRAQAVAQAARQGHQPPIALARAMTARLLHPTKAPPTLRPGADRPDPVSVSRFDGLTMDDDGIAISRRIPDRGLGSTSSRPSTP